MAKYDFLFVITYGRSGSTLLQGILNSFDGYCIRGENGSALLPIFRSYRNARDAKAQWGEGPTDATSPWFGIELIEPKMLAEEMIASFRKHILRVPPGTRVAGFKEIRYMASYFKEGEFADYLAFIDQWFPNSAFVFNSRNIDAVAASGWWKDDPNAMADLVATEALMRSAANRYRDQSIWLEYEEFCSNVTHLKGLAEFLGETFDPDRIQAVLKEKHSF
jgi:hypothetical protein